MLGINTKRELEIIVEHVRPGLFCVHFQWNYPSMTVKKKNKDVKNPLQLGNNDGNLNTDKAAILNPAIPSSGAGTRAVEGMVSGSLFDELQQQEVQHFLYGTSTANRNHPQTHHRSLRHTIGYVPLAGLVKRNVPRQRNFTFVPPETPFESTARESSSVHGIPIELPEVNTPLESSINTSGQPTAKDDAIKYTAKFLINKQVYILKASFTTSTGITLGSLTLKQVTTKPCPATEKAIVDEVSGEPSRFEGKIENDNIQSPSAVWVNLSGIEKKHRKLKFSNSDQSWVLDDFDGSFVHSACYNTGPTDWKPLAGSLWIEFVTSNMGEKKALKQVTDLYVEQIYCDVQFSLRGEQQIGSHRNILAARSPVFAAMFQHDMKEATTGQVHMEDSEPDVFKQLLHYIYSGRISTPLTDAMAQSLFVVADKYEIQDLKEECVIFLLTCLRMDNVVGLLVWSYLYSVEELKEVTLTFMAHHGKEICLLKDWEELAKNYPELSVLATRRMMDCKV
ncbi:uncharacterized protein LOC116926900 isoform X2 [Daphnia magna]|uniref:uncharacterized protein LOC116926900 isoform X2 n=1 Tax=Daphnia magna TaxID=35525 RepID=UPI001E1BD468|nr:uncharacterized protein LOC116926900 isoform X2 [Daphnia magna]